MTIKEKMIKEKLLCLCLIGLLNIVIAKAESLSWEIGYPTLSKVVATLNIEDSTLIINGVGEMKDWSSPPYVPWHSNRDNIATVIINSGITNIGNSAFQSCINLSSVSISGSVKKLRGFSYCTKLTSIFIPSSVIEIVDNPFTGCSNLTEINIGLANPQYTSKNGIIYSKAYDTLVLCPSGKTGNIDIPYEVINIGDWAFRDCEKITSVTIPNNTTGIGSFAFSGCSSLVSIKLSNNISHIGDEAFSSCSSLTSVTLPQNLTKIGRSSFYYCQQLNSISIPNSVTDIGEKAFYSCRELITVTIPKNVTSIGHSAFADCSLLTEINVDATNTNYSSVDGVLYSKQRDIILQYPAGKSGDFSIPKNIKNINSNAFNGCKNLTSVIIPSTVEQIGDNAFLSCTALNSIFNYRTTPQYIGNSAFHSISNKCLLHVPVKSLSAYKSWSGWNSFQMQGIDNDGNYAWLCGGSNEKDVVAVLYSDTLLYFYGTGTMNNYGSIISSPWASLRNKIKTIEIEEGGVTTIGNNAFNGFENLTSVVIPNSIETVGSYAFSNCSNLTAVNIGKSLSLIGDYAFRGCNITKVSISSDNANFLSEDGVLFNKEKTALILNLANRKKNYVIPTSVSSIGKNAFYDCQYLISATIPNNVTTIGNNAFYNCNKLDTIIVSWEMPINITNDVFTNVSINMVNLIVPENKTEIYASSDVWKDFYIAGTESPTIASGICDDNLTWTLSLRKLTINGSGRMETSTTVPWSAYNKDIKTISIEEGITSIGKNAFKDCYNLNTVTIPNSINSIDIQAFYGCKQLNIISITDNVTNIGDYAFAYCDELNSVTIPESVTNIGQRAFLNCKSLLQIYIPSKVSYIGSGAFASCSSLEAINVDKNNANYLSEEGVLLNKKKTALIQYPVNKQGGYVIPNDVTSIWDDAFRDCKNLTFISIPNNVMSFGNWAFQNCSSLTSIIIPSEVTWIGSYAFYNCSNLKKIYNRNPIPQNFDYDSFGSVDKETCILYVPTGALDAYKNANIWKDFLRIIEEVINTNAISTTNSVEIEWVSVSNATNYILTIYADEMQEHILEKYNIPASSSQYLRYSLSGSTLSYTIEGLSANTMYHYSIQAFDEENNGIETYFGNFTTQNLSNIENIVQQNILIYPNPAHDELLVSSQYSHVDKIEIFNLEGRILTQINNADKINVSQLPRGIYIVKVFTHNQTHIQKILKK